MENRNDKGQLQKGHSGLRKKGTLNKKTVEIKERIEMVLEILDESIEAEGNNEPALKSGRGLPQSKTSRNRPAGFQRALKNKFICGSGAIC